MWDQLIHGSGADFWLLIVCTKKNKKIKSLMPCCCYTNILPFVIVVLMRWAVGGLAVGTVTFFTMPELTAPRRFAPRQFSKTQNASVAFFTIRDLLVKTGNDNWIKMAISPLVKHCNYHRTSLFSGLLILLGSLAASFGVQRRTLKDFCLSNYLQSLLLELNLKRRKAKCFKS